MSPGRENKIETTTTTTISFLLDGDTLHWTSPCQNDQRSLIIIVLLLILLCYGVNLLMALETSQCICTEKHQVFFLLIVRAQCLPLLVFTHQVEDMGGNIWHQSHAVP